MQYSNDKWNISSEDHKPEIEMFDNDANGSRCKYYHFRVFTFKHFLLDQ